MMRTLHHLLPLLALLAGLCACTANKGGLHNNQPGDDAANQPAHDTPFVLKRLGVDRQAALRYANCLPATVDTLLAMADTIYSDTGRYDMARMGLDNDVYNEALRADWGDTLRAVVALFGSYYKIAGHAPAASGATLVWHEVARQQMKRFVEAGGGTWDEEKGCEPFFRAAESIEATYGCGTQGDMNAGAWCGVMPRDYRLAGAYKRLMDVCRDKEVTSLIHADCQHTQTTYAQFYESIDDWYSMLPLQLAWLFSDLQQAKLRNTERLTADYEAGRIGLQAVRQNLREHRGITARGESVRLNAETIRQMAEANDIY